MEVNAPLTPTNFLSSAAITWALVLVQRKPIRNYYENFAFSLIFSFNLFFIVCDNKKSGPSSINPLSKKRYASTFPILTIYDMISAQFLLLDYLGIKKVN